MSNHFHEIHNNYTDDLIVLIDVKFALGIKNIHFGFYPYTPMCVSTVYSVLTPSYVKTNQKHITRVGFEPTAFAISRAVSK